MSAPERPRLRPVPLEEDDDARPPSASTPQMDLGDLAPRHRHRHRELLDSQRARVDVLARVVVLLGVSALAAIVIGPRLVGADLPAADDLQKPARVHVRADRDYALVDRAATDDRRLDARRASRSVWDLDLARAQADARVLDGALGRVERAVASERDEAREAREREATRTGKRTDDAPSDEDRAGEVPVPADLAHKLEPVRAQVAGELALVGVEAPRDVEWVSLVAALWRFPGVSEEILGAVRDALSAPVVGDRALLALDEPRGIVVRPVPTALRRGERVIETTDEVRDLEQARLALAAELRQRLVAAAPGIAEAEAAHIAAFASSLVRTTLTYNATESELRRQEAAEAVPPELVRVHRGEMVLRPGEVMERRHLLVLSAMDAQRGEQMKTRAAVGAGAFVLLLCFVVYRFGLRGVFRRQLAVKDLVFLGALLLLGLLWLYLADRLIARVIDQWPTIPALALLCVVPTAFGAIQARLCLTADVALLFALLLALLGGVMAEPGTTWTIVALVSSMAGAAVAGRAEHTLTLLLAGVAAGVAGSAAAVTLEAFRSALDVVQLMWLGAAALGGGLLSGALAVVATGLIEAAFGYVTSLRLRALCDLNQPLLKDLIVHAPGTWHHSMRVAHLAVDGASAIGANAALARAMALYHDVGKIKDPHYFLENVQGRENPHDKLAPLASAEILLEHVRHGVELARRHRIPRVVSDVIEEHHADNRIEFFLQRARAELLRREGEAALAEQEEALDAAYRYGGPVPRTRESALVLLADQVEAASRALEEPSAEQLAEVVDHFIDRALIEDALVGCDMALRDLDRVRAAFRLALLDLHPRAAPQSGARPSMSAS